MNPLLTSRDKNGTALTIAALGVVFGDIGTSPLYAIRECFFDPHSIAPAPANVLGVMSLVFWSLILVVTLKYAVFMLRADNDGEGGILALMSLVANRHVERIPNSKLLIAVGLAGTAFLFADALITPAISVLSAVEGLNAVTTRFEPYVVPIAVLVLVILFVGQGTGTAAIGRLFGPIMLIWFTVIGLLGALSLVRTPDVLLAVNPLLALKLFRSEGWAAFAVLGIIFLVITGAEALYADLGHFGKRPIQSAWFKIALPALLLNYFGQSALLLRSPNAENLFFQLAPAKLLIPLVVIATIATAIASQAVISGAFSITSQAIHLDLLPRLKRLQTSPYIFGQIYIPLINGLFLICTVMLVISFQRSGALAGAYGIAVATTMLITSLLLFHVARLSWNWSKTASLLFTAPFLLIQSAFWAATLLKIPSGGWVPLVLAGAFYLLMIIWHKGHHHITELVKNLTMDLDVFTESIKDMPPARVPGIAVYLTARPEKVPRSLLHNLKHNKILHENVIIVTAASKRIPYIKAEERVQIKKYDGNIDQVTLNFGFREDRNIPFNLKSAFSEDKQINIDNASFFLSREDLLVSRTSSWRVPLWIKTLYVFMHLNANDPAKYFHLPSNRVIELGAQINV